ncbi:MAG: hypothetical protein ABIP63_10850 [Thermoanaerobaculia bacterium]
MDIREGSDEERTFLQAFEDCSLPAAAFHHRDHVRVAWIYLQTFPLLEALNHFILGLRRFAITIRSRRSTTRRSPGPSYSSSTSDPSDSLRPAGKSSSDAIPTF